VLPTELRAAGARLDGVVVYRNLDVERLDPQIISEIEAGSVDWICLSSPSIARGMYRLLSAAARGQLGKSARVASISPVTSAAARELGIPIAAEATTYTWDGILAAIESGTKKGEAPRMARRSHG
jgi:uroporphyrinogen III methyltransferase/synthase